MDYMNALSRGFPGVIATCVGDTENYDHIRWENGSPMPTKTAMDAWIAANPESVVITRFEFRQLFTIEERVSIDNYASNPNITDQYKAMINTMLKDLELSGEIHLNNPQVAQGLGLLVAIGMLTASRRDRILQGLLPVPE